MPSPMQAVLLGYLRTSSLVCLNLPCPEALIQRLTRGHSQHWIARLFAGCMKLALPLYSHVKSTFDSEAEERNFLRRLERLILTFPH